MKKQDAAQLDTRIEAIKHELAALGPMRPGSISKQYNVCGSPTCRCKDPKNPQKHGPYYQLSYTWKGRSTTEFVQPERLEEVQTELHNYKAFRRLTQEWVDLSMERVCLERDARKASKRKKNNT